MGNYCFAGVTGSEAENTQPLRCPDCYLWLAFVQFNLSYHNGNVTFIVFGWYDNHI